MKENLVWYKCDQCGKDTQQDAKLDGRVSCSNKGFHTPKGTNRTMRIDTERTRRDR